MKRIFAVVFFLVLFSQGAAAQYQGQTPTPVQTVPFQVVGPPCSIPNSVVNSEFQMLDASVKVQNCMQTPADGYQRGAIGAHTQVDMNGKGGKAWTGYFSAACYGPTGPYIAECGALYGRVEPMFGAYPYWHFAGHLECNSYSADAGFCGALNLELRDFHQINHGVRGKGRFIGINIQPAPYMTGVEGIQFQNGQTYKYTVNHDSGFIQLGSTHGTPFCMKYESNTQQVLFLRGVPNVGCGGQGSQVAHVIDMNWSPNLPMYVPGRRY